MFQAGFARVDVTPPLGTPLVGYFRARYAEGVLDPIELNALALSDGETKAVVVTADFVLASEPFLSSVRALIAEETGVAEDHILLTALHQHTSINAGYPPREKTLSVFSSYPDETYMNILTRKFVDAAKMAIDDLAEATLTASKRETAEPISFIRRFRMKDGSTKTNPGHLNPEIDHPIGEADNTVYFVRFAREGKGDIALVNFGTHPDVIGGSKCSADWPGFARRLTEEDLPGTHCVVVNGPQGDTNHCDVSKPAIKEPEERYANSRRMGRLIADVVVDLWDKAAPVKPGPIRGAIEWNYVLSNTDGIDRIDEYIELSKAYYAKTLDRKLSMAERGAMNRIANMRNIKLFQKVPITVFTFGDVALVGFGGEPFTAYTRAAQAAAPDKFVLCACNANATMGYFPTKEAFDEGGYEASASVFTPVVEEMLNGCVKKLLDELCER
ncbi:MAG: hypothetical protein IKQ87_00090 [Clostridia bacterium]|nr:hypothetical protein [Clostridia bacterium]